MFPMTKFVHVTAVNIFKIFAQKSVLNQALVKEQFQVKTQKQAHVGVQSLTFFFFF